MKPFVSNISNWRSENWGAETSWLLPFNGTKTYTHIKKKKKRKEDVEHASAQYAAISHTNPRQPQAWETSPKSAAEDMNFDKKWKSINGDINYVRKMQLNLVMARA